MFKLTWKLRTTPSGRSISALRGSVRRTFGSDCGGWPTPRATNGEKNVRSLDGALKEIARKGGPQDLCQGAMLASWATPTARDHKSDRGIQTDAELYGSKGRPLPRQALSAGTGAPQTSSGAGDGKYRPVEPGTFPLAHGVANRVGRLRATGNALVAPVAEAFVRAYMEVRNVVATAPEADPDEDSRQTRELFMGML